MTDQQKILSWLDSVPPKSQIEKEAGLPQGYLSKDFKWSEKTLKKVLPVVEKHGFNRNSQQCTK